MEKTFKFIFIIAVLIFCLVNIGIFLLIIKILLLFLPELNIMGVNLS